MTTNGGVSWASQSSGTTNVLESVDFPVDAQTGYIVGWGGIILRTTNGGASWNNLPSGTANDLYSVHFPLNAQTGYAVGGSGIILKTTNGGANWVFQTSGTTNYLYSVHFPVDTQTGYAVGNNGIILKTTDGGGGVSPPPAPLLSLPGNGATNVPVNPTSFVWRSASTATSYRLQVALDSGFGNIVFDQANITDTTYNVNGLSTSTTHYWRADASNANGTSPWSSVWSFTTASGGGGNGVLSGTIYNLFLDSLAGRLDSTSVLSGASVELLQGGRVVYGPVQSGTNGAYSIANINPGVYSLHSYQSITLPNNLPGRSGLDTVSVSIPISIGPGQNTQNVRLAVGLVQYKYQLISHLAHLLVNFPDWNLNVPLIFSYNEAPAQSLVDSYDGAWDSQVQEAFARLVVTEMCLSKTYGQANIVGAETVADLADPAFFLLGISKAVDDVVRYIFKFFPSLAGQAQAIQRVLFSLLLRITETPVKAAGGLLPPPWGNCLGVGYSMLVEGASARIMQVQGHPGDVFWRIVAEEATKMAGTYLVCEIYISGTQSAVDDAVSYARNKQYYGSFPSAYQQMQTYTQQNQAGVEQAVRNSSTLRAGAKVAGTVGTILAAIGHTPGLQVLTAIGGTLMSVSLIAYSGALVYAGGELITMPSEMRGMVSQIYFPPPKAALGGNPVAFGHNSGVRKSLATSVSSTQAAYDTLLAQVKAAAQAGDLARLNELASELPEMDAGYDGSLYSSLSLAFAGAWVAKDSIPNFQALYDTMLVKDESSLRTRFALATYLLSYLAEPQTAYQQGLIAKCDETRQANALAGSAVQVYLDSIARLPQPASCMVVSLSPEVAVVSPGEEFTVTATVLNTGGATAHGVIMKFSPNASLALKTQQADTIGALDPGARVSYTWRLAAIPHTSIAGGFSVRTSSTDAVNSSRTGLVWIESGSTPATGGKLANTNVYIYPNPFSPDRDGGGTLRYSLASDGAVTIEIFDASGDLVKTLCQGTPERSGIEYSKWWDGKNEKGQVVANGVYFFRIKSSTGEKAFGKAAVVR